VPVPEERWLDAEAGPFVRPYAVTRGRTMPAAGSQVGLIDIVVAVIDPRVAADLRLGPQHRQLLERCRQPITLVDLAAVVNLPVGVVRVLLTDLTEHGIVRVLPTPRGPVTDQRLLSAVLQGLQAL
jgi:uncharacterized protein DUF742